MKQEKIFHTAITALRAECTGVESPCFICGNNSDHEEFEHTAKDGTYYVLGSLICTECHVDLEEKIDYITEQENIGRMDTVFWFKKNMFYVVGYSHCVHVQDLLKVVSKRKGWGKYVDAIDKEEERQNAAIPSSIIIQLIEQNDGVPEAEQREIIFGDE